MNLDMADFGANRVVHHFIMPAVRDPPQKNIEGQPQPDRHDRKQRSPAVPPNIAPCHAEEKRIRRGPRMAAADSPE